ncbi:MAG: hypothetical protein LUF33_00080 [Clostridiales bacterium]|nr:hypothetical protein [Clostridiales bacterium]
MIFINSYRKSKILSESVYREIIIKFPDAADGELQEIGSENIIQDSFELTRSICDENEFTLGGCIAGQMTVQVVNIEEELNGKNIQVYINQRFNTENLYPEDTLYPDDTLYPGMQSEVISQTLFTGKINSSLRQKNRAVKEIIAYDALYEASNILAYNYFLNAAKYSPNQKIGDMVEAVLGYIGLSDDAGHLSNVKLNPNWEEKLSLSYEIAESVCNDKMTVLDLLQALCELNAAWGYINRNGKFLCRNFIKSDTEIIDYYADLEFEEFEQQDINMLQFTYNQNKTYKYGSSNKKSWYISDNIIAKCCADISAIVKNFH